jgi:hypothetical protein
MQESEFAISSLSKLAMSRRSLSNLVFVLPVVIGDARIVTLAKGFTILQAMYLIVVV